MAYFWNDRKIWYSIFIFFAYLYIVQGGNLMAVAGIKI